LTKLRSVRRAPAIRKDDVLGIIATRGQQCMPDIIIPEVVKKAVADSVGRIIRDFAKGDPDATARDVLAYPVRKRAAERLQKYAPLSGKRLLDVGSGFGLMLTTLIRQYDVDGYGIEPEAAGFDSSLRMSRELLWANGIDATRVIAGCGERLPFADGSFDVVYSANVLEHVEDPERVLYESVRVLKPGGILHFEIPNFLSYWEGHYLIPQPPILFRGMLPWWVKTVFRRDPAFAYTLQTLNPVWCRRQVQRLRKTFPLQLITIGEELFLERLAAPFQFNGELQSPLKPLIRGVQALNFGNWIGHVIVAAQGFYPMYLTLRREA
jgi:ubiquinone/menaquinone biosynthesis C-methylase UbiE